MKIRYLLIATCMLALAGPLAAQPVQGPNGHYYELVTATATWDAARIAAEGMSYNGSTGYLATLTSAEENDFVGTLGISTGAWFGGFQQAGTAEPSADWEWVSGETWSFTAWGPGEPNDLNGEDCAHFRGDGLWNDLNCGGARAYVVEYDADAPSSSNHTFITSIDVVGGGSHGELGVTITCNGGLPLTQSATTPVTFTVTELAATDSCSIVVDDPASVGWEMANGGCDFDPVGDPMAHECEIMLEPSESSFTTTVMWDISAEADPGVGADATLYQVCTNAWMNDSYTTVGNPNQPAGPPGGMFPMTVTPGPDGSTICSAMLNNYGSAVEVDASDCASESLLPNGLGASCTIYASAFYEGIPTLSQFGLAIMALLMLGVGFVGFRRFV